MSSPKRLNTTAAARLRNDYMRIKKDPVPYVIGAEPYIGMVSDIYNLLLMYFSEQHYF